MLCNGESAYKNTRVFSQWTLLPCKICGSFIATWHSHFVSLCRPVAFRTRSGSHSRSSSSWLTRWQAKSRWPAYVERIVCACVATSSGLKYRRSILLRKKRFGAHFVVSQSLPENRVLFHRHSPHFAPFSYSWLVLSNRYKVPTCEDETDVATASYIYRIGNLAHLGRHARNKGVVWRLYCVLHSL